ncbi:hypothetical protein M0R45_035470 [Rubus argutus]|uniref:Uncharacterized protein n=1 Tax=Rubus argutus TaxID=59490 RepID=A0AAW1VXH3_RUBAR
MKGESNLVSFSSHKEGEKRVVRKKERKRATATKATNGISEGESAPEPSPETTSVTPLESEAREKPLLLRGTISLSFALKELVRIKAALRP